MYESLLLSTAKSRMITLSDYLQYIHYALGSTQQCPALPAVPAVPALKLWEALDSVLLQLYYYYGSGALEMHVQLHWCSATHRPCENHMSILFEVRRGRRRGGLQSPDLQTLIFRY